MTEYEKLSLLLLHSIASGIGNLITVLTVNQRPEHTTLEQLREWSKRMKSLGDQVLEAVDPSRTIADPHRSTPLPGQNRSTIERPLA
jgi:hypothetical protein